PAVLVEQLLKRTVEVRDVVHRIVDVLRAQHFAANGKAALGQRLAAIVVHLFRSPRDITCNLAVSIAGALSPGRAVCATRRRSFYAPVRHDGLQDERDPASLRSLTTGEPCAASAAGGGYGSPRATIQRQQRATATGGRHVRSHPGPAPHHAVHGHGAGRRRFLREDARVAPDEANPAL